MNKDYFKFIDYFPKEKIFLNEPMKNHTSFKVGGVVDILLIPSKIEEIKLAISICIQQNIPYYILGNGTNVLVSDKGFRGVIIKLSSNYNNVRIIGEEVTCSTGISMSELSEILLKNTLTGFEFASGIPGTLGGAICMNAGAYGGEMKDIVKNCKVLKQDGTFMMLDNYELELGYRSSKIQKENFIALEVTLLLKIGIHSEIKNKIDELWKLRSDKQPLEYASAGSTFKRPKGYFAGQLIMDSGLRGYSIGDAQVSEKHCGFIINKGNATSKDIMDLILYVQEKVNIKFGIELEPEVRIIGE